jgi:hypothetical protein
MWVVFAATVAVALTSGAAGCSRDKKPDEGVEAAAKAEKTDKKHAGKHEKGRKAPRPGTEKEGSEKAVASGHRDVPNPGDKNRKPDARTIVAAPPPGVGGTPSTLNPAAQPGPAAQGSQLKDLPVPDQAARPDPSRPALADPRLLLTMADISSIAPARAKFQRAALAGMPRTEDSDSILYLPEKGDSFGFSLQLFRARNALDTKKRFESLQASYPSAQEITPVSGKTFFSYWNDTMHIGFVHPAKNLTAIVSCGRQYCDSDKLMELAGKIAERLK